MIAPDIDAWDAWSPVEVAQRFKAVPAPWCVVGGWAIDLFLGQQTRSHEDIEIAVLRENLLLFRSALPDIEFYVAGSGQVSLLGTGEFPTDHDQLWCLEPKKRVWKLDIMIEPGDATTWRYKRDVSVVVPRANAISMLHSGIPILRPHLVLLFKAKHLREKDEADFQLVLPTLGPERYWLADVIEKHHPDHHWVSALRNKTLA
jgi:hypothetical protein